MERKYVILTLCIKLLTESFATSSFLFLFLGTTVLCLTTVPTELCDAAITRIRVLYKQVCVHLPDNAALPSFARHTPLLLSAGVTGRAASDRYLLPALARGSKPVKTGLLLWALLKQKDGRTPYRYIDPVPHTIYGQCR